MFAFGGNAPAMKLGRSDIVALGDKFLCHGENQAEENVVHPLKNQLAYHINPLSANPTK